MNPPLLTTYRAVPGGWHIMDVGGARTPVSALDRITRADWRLGLLGGTDGSGQHVPARSAVSHGLTEAEANERARVKGPLGYTLGWFV